jgi:dTDP-4-dehydrorhamnose reductase
MSFTKSTPQKRRKVLITGGSGMVGLAFIEKYYDEFEFFNISRSELRIASLSRKFPRVKSYAFDILNMDQLNKIFQEIKPDVVIHAAALKHVNGTEVNQSRTIQVNILGSLNVAKASVAANVPIVVGISSDKAFEAENIYGYSKRILEQIFLEHYTNKSRFICTRFSNVACSKATAQQIRDSIDFAETSTKPRVIGSAIEDGSVDKLVTQPLSISTTAHADEKKIHFLHPHVEKQLRPSLSLAQGIM